MSLAGIVGVAALVVVVLLGLLELLARAVHARFFSTVILGSDKRTSTSKTFILMWTLLVGWALISLLIAGEFVHIHSCVPSPARVNAAHDITALATRCRASDVGRLQIGWLHFLHTGLSGAYLVLLGVPAAAGLAAAGITQSQVNNSGYKVAKTRKGAPLERVTEIFSADDGTTDLGDFQYLMFNLVTAAYFISQFVKPDGTGLPTIPDTLLGLTSVSASLYVGKKAVTRTQPTITGVFPLPIGDNRSFTVIGTGLGADPASPTAVQPQITIDGVPATLVTTTDSGLVAKAPSTLGGGGTPIQRQLQVLNPYGGITASFPIQYQ